MATAQQKLQKSLNDMKALQRDLSKKIEMRQTLDAQLSENMIVQDELKQVKADSKVYKLIGPALVRQDLSEAKQTVAKRIEYITAELKRYETVIKELEQKQQQCQDDLAKLKQEFDSQAQKSATAAQVQTKA